MLYKQLTIWFSVVMLLLLIPLIYLVGFSMPHQTKLLQADTAFLKMITRKSFKFYNQLKPVKSMRLKNTSWRTHTFKEKI